MQWLAYLFLHTHPHTRTVCDSSVSVLLRLGARLCYVLARAVRMKHAKTVPKVKRNRPKRKPLRLLISPCVICWTALCACLCCGLVCAMRKLVCVIRLTSLYACLCCGLVCPMRLSVSYA